MMDKEKDRYLHFHRADIGEEEINEVVDTLRSGWLTTGPRTKKFEAIFKDYIGAKNAIGLNSCTAGLHIALAALGITKGDEVITSPITFPATINVIFHCGAKPVFADVLPDTLTVDPSSIEEAITKKTRAIIPVHFAGYPCDMDSIMDIARRHNLVVIEDAAHALESEYKGRKIGAIGDCTSFSFYATKNITTGEGGMVTTNRDDLVKKMRELSLHGISKDAWKRYGRGGFTHWEHLCPGFKYNMFDIQAAIGIHQIKRVGAFWKKRNLFALMYNEAFSQIKEIEQLKIDGNIKHAHHLFVILLNRKRLKITRDEFLIKMQEKKIGVGVHFRALHTQPLYKNLYNSTPVPLKNSENISERIVSLPIYPKMTKEDAAFVISSVLEIVDKARR